jgi:hypothetical protein
VTGNANIDASLTTGIVSADITSGNVILGTNSSDSVNVFGGAATLGTGAGQEGFLLGDGSLTLGAAANQVAISPVPAGASSMIAPAASTVCSTMAASSPHKAQHLYSHRGWQRAPDCRDFPQNPAIRNRDCIPKSAFALYQHSPLRAHRMAAGAISRHGLKLFDCLRHPIRPAVTISGKRRAQSCPPLLIRRTPSCSGMSIIR